MPSKSDSQARLMAAAAHTPGGYGGVPQSVGQDFNTADKGTARLSHAMRRQKAQAKALRSRRASAPEQDDASEAAEPAMFPRR